MEDYNSRKIDKELRQGIETAKQLEDKELEMNLIGYMLSISYVQVQEVRRIVKTQYFYHADCRHIYQIICWFNDKGETATSMNVFPEVMKRGKIKPETYLSISGCNSAFVSYIAFMEHINILVDYAKRRDLWLLGQKMLKEGTCVGAELDKVGEEIKNGIDDILYDSVGDGSVSMQQLLYNIQDIVDINLKGGENKYYTKCGFKGIDEKSGLSRGDLDIIAASSSIGKTSLAVSMAINLISQGEDIAFFSTEMSPVQIATRILSAYTQLYSSTILKKRMTEEQLDKFNEGMSKVHEISAHLHFSEEETSDFNKIKQYIRKLHAKKHIKGVFVDFIQRLSGKSFNESKFEFYARVSQELKDIAKELDIYIVALSQITDEETDKNLSPNIRFLPSVNKLKGSSEIFDAADNVWLIHRPSVLSVKKKIEIGYPPPFENVVTENTAMILIGKGRNDGIGEFIVGFDENTTHFYDIDNIPYKNAAEMSMKNSSVKAMNTYSKEDKKDKEEQTDLPF